MNNDDLEKLAKEAHKNYVLSQWFTGIAAITVLYLVYTKFYSKVLISSDNTSFYILLTLTIISIVLSFMFSRKMRTCQEDIGKIVGADTDLVKLFTRTKLQEGCCMIFLIAVFVATFWFSGTQLDFLDDIGFLIIIFSFWNTNRNMHLFFVKLSEKGII